MEITMNARMTLFGARAARATFTIGVLGAFGAFGPACAAQERVDTGAPAAVAGLPAAHPSDVGMSPEALARIGPAMRAYVDDGRLAGIMAMVARRGHVVHWNAVGARRLDEGDALQPDDLFRIYSMTKPITSVAALILVEEGRIALDDPVSDFIPGFADLTVLSGAGERVSPARPMTVRHLLTHTSGLTYGFIGDTEVDRLYQQSAFFTSARGLDDMTARLTELPLVAHPGSRWTYSVATDVLGRVIEVVSGQPLDVFVRERILDPLGMEDTGFSVPLEKRARFTASYRVVGDRLELADSPADGAFTGAPAWVSGGGGLVSTASDYVRFVQMLLDGGRLGEVRVLRPESVQAITSNQLPDALVPINLEALLPPAYGFGLGVAVLVHEDVTPEPDHVGSYFWGGAANTFFWVDPEAELVAMVWTQIEPIGVYPIESEFRALVYAALR
jgi:CubicO group peptidase (beta-lactamase class C family)